MSAQRIKIVKAESDPFDHFDSVIQPFAEAVVLFIFPTVLYVSPPMADGTGGRADFFHIGGSVCFDPLG